MTIPARRVGVFGGAFDPPHVAHVALARAAVEQLRLDELRVFPTGQAWHKPNALSPAEHRLAMARIAFDGLPQTVIDERELRRPGATYTIDTLRELAAEMPGAQLFLVMGEDQAVSLTRWHEWRAILAMTTVCMASRAADPNSGPRLLPVEAELRLLRLPEMPESATQVRDRVAAEEGIAHLVPPGVARYIDQHSLYQPA
ncbi:nicotinate-nucleotide adenylyltransferase [Ramlibacter sp. WS9]|uniref:nicotinate-nucleotide adenylyltransferase n=1 Tax=Ramlibacter sp. WS9 TaxID=1882741 RepID=UPI001E4826E6|nr:nicotinate-nucleotide adenylyltransferase [Ramlibacter sp. WS9]